MQLDGQDQDAVAAEVTRLKYREGPGALDSIRASLPRLLQFPGTLEHLLDDLQNRAVFLCHRARVLNCIP
jgi:hypothetical protein